MSLPLIDFRGKTKPETDAVLEVIQGSTGRDKSGIAREWMHKIAEREMYAAIELQKIQARGKLSIGVGAPIWRCWSQKPNPGAPSRRVSMVA